MLTKMQKTSSSYKGMRPKGLEVAKPWGFLGDIGDAVNSYAKKMDTLSLEKLVVMELD